MTLTPNTVTALRAHRARQAADRLVAGAGYAGHNLVFAAAGGGAMRAATVRRALGSALRRASLPVVRVHDLRHSSATIMLASGTDAHYVAARLGHANVAFTLARYAHVTPRIERDALARLAAALG